MSSTEENTLGVALSSIDAKPEHLQLAEQLAASMAATLQERRIDESTFIVTPPGFEVYDATSDLEKAKPVRNRPQGTVHLGDVPSLLAYCVDQAAQERGYIYADPDARTMTAVFNDQRSTLAPGWRDHRAHFAAAFTPEFKKWLENNGKALGQTEFAEFIEDNLQDLHADHAQTLLTVATTIQATNGINFNSARRLQDGQTQLTYNEVIDAKAGADGALKIPQTFTLGLRIFKNGEGYKLTARLKYRINSGTVKF